MGLSDIVRCDYPLPEPDHQDWGFETRSLECQRDEYTITRDGRLVRHGGRGGGHDRDVEFPFHGDVEMHMTDPGGDPGVVRYRARFSHGRVDWIRRIGEGGAVLEDSPSGAALSADRLAPEGWGRPLTVEEFAAFTPEKMELVRGRIPGGETLVVLLLTALGLRRVAALVGFDRWRSALPGSDAPSAEGAHDAPEPRRGAPDVLERRLLAALKQRRGRLKALLEESTDDAVYRFYHQSIKVYSLQAQTRAIVIDLAALMPGQALNPWFLQILEQGTRPRPILEAFFHARYFLEMAVRYADLVAPPSVLPSGYAALLYLYGLRR